MEDDMTNILSHYGIPGMHWGRRKTPSTPSADHQTARSLKGKKLSEMSNDEIKLLSGRMNLEKQYKEALRQDIHPGKKFAQDVLVSAGKQVASKMVAQVLDKGARDLVRFAAERSRK
jgi:hypothetical protein